MLKKRQRSLASHFLSSAFVVLLAAGLASCDRGATEQIQAAEKFADAVARNNVGLRDSMIATQLFRKYFQNDYVASDFITWIQSIYDLKERKFFGAARADVDRDLKPDLRGTALIDFNTEIEESGMVRIKSQNKNDPPAYFWMVKQKGKHWMVAMVTKGEMQVDFNASTR